MKTKKTQPLRAIAKVTSVFGIRGEVKIFSYVRTADEFENLKNIFCGEDETNAVPCKIASVKVRGNDIYLKLAEYADRTAAESLRGKFLFVEEKHRKQLPPGKFFVDDIIGCTVVNEDGNTLGVVASVNALPLQTIYTVRTEKGDVMMPTAKEFILSVNVEKKEIIVRLPEGLFSGEML